MKLLLAFAIGLGIGAMTAHLHELRSRPVIEKTDELCAFLRQGDPHDTEEEIEHSVHKGQIVIFGGVTTCAVAP
jgi:hypothetical protein